MLDYHGLPVEVMSVKWNELKLAVVFILPFTRDIEVCDLHWQILHTVTYVITITITLDLSCRRHSFLNRLKQKTFFYYTSI